MLVLRARNGKRQVSALLKHRISELLEKFHAVQVAIGNTSTNYESQELWMAYLDCYKMAIGLAHTLVSIKGTVFQITFY